MSTKQTTMLGQVQAFRWAIADNLITRSEAIELLTQWWQLTPVGAADVLDNLEAS